MNIELTSHGDLGPWIISVRTADGVYPVGKVEAGNSTQRATWEVNAAHYPTTIIEGGSESSSGRAIDACFLFVRANLDDIMGE